MAAKKKTAKVAKTAKKAKAAKPPKTAPAKAAAAPTTAADKGPIGHNRIPSKKDVQGYLDRTDRIREQRAVKNSEFMHDEKAVYSDMASRFGISKKIARMYVGIYRGEQRIADQLAELEVKETDDMDRMLAAGSLFGENTPFGAFCIAQGTLRELRPQEELPPPLRAEIVGRTKPSAKDGEDDAEDSAKAKGHEGFNVGMNEGEQDDEGGDAATQH